MKNDFRVHAFIIESEEHQSPTSIRGVWGITRSRLQSVGRLGNSTFVDAATRADLVAASESFATWSKQVPKSEPIVLWLSVHGWDPEPDVEDEKRTLVGTSACSSADEEIDWTTFLEPAKQAFEPSRVVVLMDVCWGSSPTAPARLTTPEKSRPYMLFGPARSAARHELDTASARVFHALAKSGLPTPDAAKSLVEGLNAKFTSSGKPELPFYRVWYWSNSGLVHHPESAQQIAKRQT